jgi:pimeloyl-ACP methyl ester carboxylesterase
MTSHRIETSDGAVLHVEEDGAGPPVFLVNGAFCSVRQWDRAVPELARSFRVIRHDVRGSGRSGAGPDDHNRFERYADDIVAIGDHLGAGQSALWGMAWGARVAIVAAARHAERFSRLVLSDLGIDPADVEAQKAGAKAAAAARARAGIAEIPRPEGWRDHEDFDAARKAMAATFQHPDLMPFVTQVTIPVLVVTGEHDPNLVSSRRALSGLSNGQLEVLPHTGHGSVLQRPDLVTQKVGPFLAE